MGQFGEKSLKRLDNDPRHVSVVMLRDSGQLILQTGRKLKADNGNGLPIPAQARDKIFFKSAVAALTWLGSRRQRAYVGRYPTQRFWLRRVGRFYGWHGC